MKRLLDRDPYTGIETWHEYDAAEQKTRIFYEFTRDDSPAIDACKALANDGGYSQRGIKEEFWHYAHVPDSLRLKWFVEKGVPLWDAQTYNALANTPDYKWLKVTTKSDGSKGCQIYLP